MASTDVQCKLTAILITDVVGYSRLRMEDGEATVEAIPAYCKVFPSCVEQYRGRVVNAPGDSILVVFASLVDLVNGVLEIQRNIFSKRVLGLPG